MDTGESFARVLKKRRRQAGLTQEQLAEKCGLSTRYISLLECNSQQPTLGYIYILAGGLGISMAGLVEAVEEDMRADEGESGG